VNVPFFVHAVALVSKGLRLALLSRPQKRQNR
jgi:hypothetical protein